MLSGYSEYVCVCIDNATIVSAISQNQYFNYANTNIV